MKLFAEFVLIKSVLEGLIKLFFILLVCFDEEIFNFDIIVLLSRFQLENTQYFYSCHCIKRKYGKLT